VPPLAAGTDFTSQDMATLGWSSGAHAFRLRQTHWGETNLTIWLGALGALLWLCAFVMGFFGPLRTAAQVVGGVGGAMLIACLLPTFIVRYTFLLLLGDRLEVWQRLRLRNALVRRWQCPLEQVQWLRDELTTWEPSHDPAHHRLVLGCPPGELSFEPDHLEDDLDWVLLKETILKSAHLGRRQDVRRQNWWSREEYTLYSREPMPPGESRR